MTTNGTSTPSVTDAARECRARQRAWSAVPVRQRLRPVRAFRRWLVSACDRLCAAVAQDQGKTTDETLGGEILPLAAACRFLESDAARLLRPRRSSIWRRPVWLWGQADTVHRRPRGVVAIIGTWNYPVFLNGVQLVQALTAGNGVLWKPSELAPTSAAVLFDLLGQAGFPPGLVHLLPATREAGAELIEADVDHVVFTGSAATGRVLARRLGERLISSTLELSGCDPLFVLEDADVELAARAAWFGATLNRGQTCLAVRRAFVHRPVYPQFLEALRPFTAAPPCRLALDAQVQQADRLVKDALARGAQLVAPPGKGDETRTPLAGLFLPTVLADVRPDMPICREASFAPLLTVTPFDHLGEALAMNQQCSYGLGASVFTRDAHRADHLAAHLTTGMVTVNDAVAPTAHPATPFGGRRDSGWGVTQGVEGLLEMTVPQVVSVRTDRFRPHYDLAAGMGGNQEELFRGLLEWGHGKGVLRRWRGLWKTVRGLWRFWRSGPG